ncbi:hypothetical protein RJ640_026474 [Escallonia rubra]|uniref:VQ domain-containing protein n=1 Tax=Escallonia rubra TaxID=112253 RepID=A0AA88UJD3_9ASTE|nr:hypothetical protein RJ640_014229 [Escallonia rubra]KAK2987194.1 hypothetical protein RJ640_026474 [Escallonia rubra]
MGESDRGTMNHLGADSPESSPSIEENKAVEIRVILTKATFLQLPAVRRGPEGASTSADTTTFKQVVQMLTGSSDTAKQASSKPNQLDPTPSRNSTPLSKQGKRSRGLSSTRDETTSRMGL